MAFPTTPVLDRFTDPSAPRLLPVYGPTTWAIWQFLGRNLETKVGGTAGESTADSSSYWLPFRGEDAEALVEIVTTDNLFGVSARIIDPTNGVGDHYDFYYDSIVLGGARLQKWTGGSAATIADDVPLVLPDGSWIGISVVGNQISAYYKSGPGGSWRHASFSPTTDNSITGQGYIGIWIAGSLGRMDNFSGGRPVPSTDVPVPHLLGRSAGW